MTIKELSQLYYIEKLIERDTDAIRRIEERLTAISPVLSGMPHASGANDKIGNGVPELVDLKEKLQKSIQKADITRMEIRDGLESIEDARVKLACVYRFLDLMTWQGVADAMGDDSTEASIKMLVKRYFDSLGETGADTEGILGDGGTKSDSAARERAAGSAKESGNKGERSGRESRGRAKDPGKFPSPADCRAKSGACKTGQKENRFVNGAKSG